MLAISRKNPSLNGEEQAFEDARGRVFVGIDAWRYLDRKDFPSHPVKTYPSVDLFLDDYKLIKK